MTSAAKLLGTALGTFFKTHRDFGFESGRFVVVVLFLGCTLARLKQCLSNVLLVHYLYNFKSNFSLNCSLLSVFSSLFPLSALTL